MLVKYLRQQSEGRRRGSCRARRHHTGPGAEKAFHQSPFSSSNPRTGCFHLFTMGKRSCLASCRPVDARYRLEAYVIYTNGCAVEVVARLDAFSASPPRRVGFCSVSQLQTKSIVGHEGIFWQLLLGGGVTEIVTEVGKVSPTRHPVVWPVPDPRSCSCGSGALCDREFRESASQHPREF